MDGFLIFGFLFTMALEAFIIYALLSFIRILLARDENRAIIFESISRDSLATINDNTTAINHLKDRFGLLAAKFYGQNLPVDQDAETVIREIE